METDPIIGARSSPEVSGLCFADDKFGMVWRDVATELAALVCGRKNDRRGHLPEGITDDSQICPIRVYLEADFTPLRRREPMENISADAR